MFDHAFASGLGQPLHDHIYISALKADLDFFGRRRRIDVGLSGFVRSRDDAWRCLLFGGGNVDLNRAGYSDALLPLTPALSLRERENGCGPVRH